MIVGGTAVGVGATVDVGVLGSLAAVGATVGKVSAGDVTVGARVGVGVAQPAPRRTVPIISVMSNVL
jgi:hypothetical protein